MFSLIGFFEDQDGAGVDHYVAASPDDHVTILGDYVYIPDSMPNIIGGAVFSAADAALTSAHIETPALSRVVYPYLEPLVNAIVPGSPPEGVLFPMNEIPIDPGEGMRFVINSDDSAGDDEYGFVWLSDGPQQPVQGRIFSLRATAAITLAEGTWVNGVLTFTETLPVGNYQIVGMRARGTNLVAARLNFVGSSHRPGVIAVNAIGDRDMYHQRFGRMGVYGEFNHRTPPTVECMGVTDTSQVFVFDLIKIS